VLNFGSSNVPKCKNEQFKIMVQNSLRPPCPLWLKNETMPESAFY